VTYIGYVTKGSSDGDNIIIQIPSRDKFRSMRLLNIGVNVALRLVHLIRTSLVRKTGSWFITFLCSSFLRVDNLKLAGISGSISEGITEISVFVFKTVGTVG
jgi:hypothetical protein